MKNPNKMEIFNRIAIILIFAGLYALGLFMAFNAFDFAGYQLSNLPNTLGLIAFYDSLLGFTASLKSGSLSGLDIALLSLVALVGLVLFVLELKPPRPRRVRLQQGTYVTRRAVEEEAIEAVEQNPEVLGSNVSVKARRRPGAKVDIRASFRPGENSRNIDESAVRDQVQRYLAEAGIPVSNLKVRLAESDPRKTKTRVR